MGNHGARGRSAPQMSCRFPERLQKLPAFANSWCPVRHTGHRHGRTRLKPEIYSTMTAIFAYSSPTVAFVAGDTLRAVPGLLLPSVITCKVHFWSDQAVFGQAGTQFQSQMIADTKAAKLQWTDQTTGSVQYDDSEAWLHKTFARFRPSRYAEALKSNGAVLSGGSLLVASVSAVGVGSGLARYDFATGSRTSLMGQVAADGTDEAAFLGIANKQLDAMKARSSETVPLDEWARNCLAEAMALYPTAVGWPADLLIAKPDGRGGRLIVQKRIDASSAVGDPIFVG